MTAGVEITRSGSKVARALVSVQSRYNQTIDETSSTGQKLVKWYKQHNIAIKDSEGEQRKLYDTLTDVSKIWKQLSKDEQLYYLNIQAGANQTQNLSAILQNFTQVQNAHQIALNSENSALDENARAMENLNKKIDAIKASWDELILALADSDAIKDLLDTVNNGLRSLAENEKAIDTLVALAKALALFKGLQIGKNFLGGLITSGKEGIKTGKKLISVLTDIPIVLGWIKELGAKETFTTLFPKLAGQITSIGSALATIAPYVGVFVALAGAVGLASGKFAEMHNQHIAETSNDIYEVADATLALVSAYKEFEHGGKGKGAKQVWGQDALDALIPKLQNVQEEYEKSEISAQEFLDKIGDISPLVDYYNSLQNIIDSGGELSQTQQDNYKALSKVVGAYDSATTRVENYDKALKINKANTNISIEAATLFAQSLEQVGGKYQFVSEEAKKAAQDQLKTEIELTKQTLKQISARMAARLSEFGTMEEFSQGVLSKASPTAAGKFMSSKAGKAVSRYYELQKALEEINKMGVSASSGGISGGGTRGKGGSGGGGDKDKTKKDQLEKYKKLLEKYQETQEDLYRKGEITASEYYSRVEKKGRGYYQKLKEMGDDYRKTNSTVVTSIFDEIDYKYKEGIIDGQKYYSEIWKYAKKFYKNGKIDFDTYRKYIKKGYEGMFDGIKKQYESGQITAEQYMSKVKKAQASASSSITSAAKSGKISGTTIRETRNALVTAAVAAKNAAAKALKEAAIKAAEAAVDAAQKRLSKANTFISALQFYANEQMDSIDKVIDGYNDEIDKLNEQMDLLDKQNDALDKQAERIKLVNALEDAKKEKTVRVYDSSLGWVD